MFLVAPWDFLREPVNIIAGVAMPVNFLFFVVALILFGISFLAWRKKGSRKLLLVSASFGLFLAKSILMLLDYFVSPGVFMNYAIQGFFDLLILLALFLALFRE
jgi:hypothetical protein